MSDKIAPHLSSASPAASACARCGSQFTCGAVAGTSTCWCVAQPRLQNILPYQTCLCPDCLALALKEEQDVAVLSHSAGRQPGACRPPEAQDRPQDQAGGFAGRA